ncbi:MAG: TlpA disulfide reductase family protein [Saprospiraceae bacterium]
MRNIKYFLVFLLPALAVFSACQGQSGYTLKGTIANAANLQVLLEQAHFDRSTVALGRSTCDANGAFSITQPEPLPEGLYRLSIGAKRMYFMLDGTEKTVDIQADLNTIDKMEVQVKGSPTLTCYADIIQNLIKVPLKTPEDAKAAAKKGCTPLMQAFLVSQLLGQNAGPYIEDFKAASQSLATAMPGSKYATDYAGMVSNMTSKATQQNADETIQIGMDAPEISLPGPDGKTHSLSKLKGKVVLLDFWASWCGPCRRANPHVVDTYKKYHDKGFEVFSVSLDRQDGKQAWIDAIQKDGLQWDNHVSDLQFWNSAPAATYGVRSIPKTFLIGKDGKIVAVNPRDQLEAELLKVL